MSLAVNNTILASDFISLKARIKAECSRRKYYGSVEKYASSQYDYTVTPVAGNAPLPEHYNKIIVPYNALSGSKLAVKTSQEVIPALKTLSDNLSTLEQISADSDSSGCKSSCTGLCQGTCTGTCTSGCTGSCSGTCSGSCSGGCGGACSIDCTGVCSDSCQLDCGYDCGSMCVYSCSGDCTGGCLTGCEGSCSGGASNYPT